MPAERIPHTPRRTESSPLPVPTTVAAPSSSSGPVNLLVGTDSVRGDSRTVQTRRVGGTKTATPLSYLPAPVPTATIRPTTAPTAHTVKPASAPTESLGARIARFRRRRGISQVACAGLVGRSENWLSKVENGHITIDRLSVLRELARVLRVDLSTLLDTQAVTR